MKTCSLKNLCLTPLLCLIALVTLAQSPPDPVLPTRNCGTQSLPADKRRALEAEAALAFRLKQAEKTHTVTYVPIRPHIVRRSNGTGGFNTTRMNNAMAIVNSKYRATNIQFYFSGTAPNYINDDGLFAGYSESGDEATLTGPNSVTNAMNQYYIQAFLDDPSLGGYAYYPDNALYSTISVIKDPGVTTDNDYDFNHGLLPHEIGHNFNLIHTFDSSNGFELVNGSNCATAGDLVCDTPADPYKRFPAATSNCVAGCPPAYVCNITEPVTGSRYSPMPNNLMSYYGVCNYAFTPGQYARIQAGLALRQSHRLYSLNAPSTNVTPASNLTTTVANARLVLSWTDNANNEMGYFIERSTSPDPESFVPVGGVAANATSFTDVTAPSGQPIYYRVRPSNSTGNSSTIVQGEAPVCRPTFAEGCSEFSTGVGSFTVNGQVLSQNSGCSASAYGQFTAVAPAVTPGNTYAFRIAPINSTNSIRYGIWADFNQNTQLTDAGELIYQSTSASRNPVSGTFTVPASASAGVITLRVIALSSANAAPFDPCGSYDYGEAEDYRLTVVPTVCNAMTTLRSGNWTDPTVWSCNRVPVAGETVTVLHAVTVPAAVAPNPTGFSRRVSFGTGGRLTFASGGKLSLN